MENFSVGENINGVLTKVETRSETGLTREQAAEAAELQSFLAQYDGAQVTDSETYQAIEAAAKRLTEIVQVLSPIEQSLFISSYSSREAVNDARYQVAA